MPRQARLDAPGVLRHVMTPGIERHAIVRMSGYWEGRKGRQAQGKGTQRVLPAERVIGRVCQAVGVRAEELRGGGRRAAVSRARAGVAYLWSEWLGQSGPAAARALGVHPATIYEVARRGRQEAAYWGQLCADVKSEFPCNVP